MARCEPYDPVTLASTAVLLLATGVMACWIPARRAARVDPNSDSRGTLTDPKIRVSRLQLVQTAT